MRTRSLRDAPTTAAPAATVMSIAWKTPPFVLRDTQHEPERAHLSSFETNFDEALDLAQGLPGHAFTRNGLLDRYGADYALDDFIAYMFYGHEREHSAQIKLFRSTLERS